MIPPVRDGRSMASDEHNAAVDLLTAIPELFNTALSALGKPPTIGTLHPYHRRG